MNTKNSKWILPTVLTAIVVISLLAISAAPASAQIDPEDRNEAIEKGLEWLAAEQDPDTGAWNLGSYPVGSTAFAVLKFAHHAKNNRVPPIDPFDPAYEYSDNFVNGLNYIFENARDASVDYVNGEGIYFSSGRTMYETGIVMMALEASCHPENIVDAPGSPIDDWTYEDVMKATVDFVAWAQNEGACPGPKGGWRYNPNYGNSDNSVSQWPVLGLMSAAYGWGIEAPDWVKTELENCWLVYSQGDDGCFGYTAPGSYTVSGPVGVTAAGLIELTYCDVTTDDPRWVAGRRCICENWGNSNIGNLYTMYGVMKAAMTAQPEPIWDFCGHEWQPLYDEWLIDNQADDGSWDAGPWGDEILCTEWALLILQKVVPPPPVISVYVDIKPGSCPNPLNKKSKGVLPVAVLGTDDFDVTAIDPETILLNRSCEGCEGVSPIRWSYEDVATPFEGELCDCHDLEGDGILDLTLKFDTQELVDELDLCPHDGETIPLTITGNLKSGTPIEGEDCIRVSKQSKSDG